MVCEDFHVQWEQMGLGSPPDTEVVKGVCFHSMYNNNGPKHAWKATHQRRCQRYVFLFSISRPTTHLFPGWAGPTNHPHGWNKSNILIQLSVVFIWQLKSFSVACSAQGIYFFLYNVLVLFYYIFFTFGPSGVTWTADQCKVSLLVSTNAVVVFTLSAHAV